MGPAGLPSLGGRDPSPILEPTQRGAEEPVPAGALGREQPGVLIPGPPAPPPACLSLPHLPSRSLAPVPALPLSTVLKYRDAPGDSGPRPRGTGRAPGPISRARPWSG